MGIPFEGRALTPLKKSCHVFDDSIPVSNTGDWLTVHYRVN